MSGCSKYAATLNTDKKGGKTGFGVVVSGSKNVFAVDQ